MATFNTMLSNLVYVTFSYTYVYPRETQVFVPISFFFNFFSSFPPSTSPVDLKIQSEFYILKRSHGSDLTLPKHIYCSNESYRVRSIFCAERSRGRRLYASVNQPTILYVPAPGTRNTQTSYVTQRLRS